MHQSTHSRNSTPGTSPLGSAPEGGSALPSPGLSLNAYMGIFGEHKWWVLGTAMAATVLATVVVNLMTPLYRASATLLVENSQRRVIDFEELAGVPAASREFFQTQAEFMQSREVGIRVIKALDLTKNPLFGKGADESASDDRTRSILQEKVLDRYQRHLEIVPVKNSQLIQIRYELPDPVLASKIANQTAESYITAELDARFEQQQNASRWLTDRLNQVRGDLEKAENVLQNYREEIGLVATPGAALGGNEQKFTSLTEQLIAARLERSRAEQIYRQVAPGVRNRFHVPEVFNNPAVVTARTAESVAEQKMADIASSLGPSHPAYKTAKAELDIARANLRRQSEGVIASIAKTYEAAVRAEKELEKEAASSKGNIQDINRKEGHLNVLQREVDTAQQIYQTFLARVKESNATADFQTPIARVVDPAVPPITAVKPPKLQIILIALLLGTLLGMALAVIRERRNAVIRSSDDVQEKLGAQLLVAVPRLPESDAQRLPQLQHFEPQSTFAESIRSAVTGIRLSMMEVSHPVISVTSTVPGEGKSSIACAIAIEQARTRKTVLIDTDMRKPSLRRMLGISSNQKGLSDIFAGENIQNCIVYVSELNLWVITSGSRKVRHGHDLLMSSRFAWIISQLRESFELVVMDTAPIELISDALPVGRQSDGMIYVVSSGNTLLPMVRRGMDRLKTTGIPMLGVILNHHDFEKASRYYGEHSAYGKEYAKAYQDTSQES